MVTVNIIDIISNFQFFQKKSSTKSNTFHCSCQNAKQDTNYLNSTMLENELNAKYEKLDLSDEQQNVIMHRKLLIPLLLSEWGCNAVFPY